MPAETAEITIPSVDPAKLGYLAGIMDGEGYFQGSPRSHSFGLRVAMTDRCVIDWLHTHFSGWTAQQGVTKVGNPVYVWALQRKADLRYLLPLLEPLLVCKAAQARAMLRYIEHLDGRPSKLYMVETSRAPKSERQPRREAMQEWRDRRDELKAEIALARGGHPAVTRSRSI